MLNKKIISQTSIAELEASIENFKQNKFRNISSTEVIKWAVYYCRFLDNRLYGITKGNEVYRGRKNDGMAFRNICQVWYPPQEHTPLMRCNYENDPVFYGATFDATICAELKLENNDLFTMIRLIINRNIRCYHLGAHGDVTNHKTSLGVNLMNNNIHSLLSKSDSMVGRGGWAISKDDKTKLKLVTDFLCDIFIDDAIEERKHYLFTSTISKIILNSPNVEALTYPSFPSHHSGVNIVFKPSVANKVLDFKAAGLCKANSYLYRAKHDGKYYMNTNDIVSKIAYDLAGNLTLVEQEYVKKLAPDMSQISRTRRPDTILDSKKVYKTPLVDEL